MAFHRTFALAVTGALRGGFMWGGGKALFDDLTTVGALFAVLRYLGWLQQGLTGASNAYARILAGAGSLERIIELHDR